MKHAAAIAKYLLLAFIGATLLFTFVYVAQAQVEQYRVTTISNPEARTMYRLTVAPTVPADPELAALFPRERLVVEYPRSVPNGTITQSPRLIDAQGRMFCFTVGVLLAECEVAK
jgi:hypothetical protein